MLSFGIELHLHMSCYNLHNHHSRHILHQLCQKISRNKEKKKIKYEIKCLWYVTRTSLHMGVYLLGQLWVLQAWLLIASPTHCFPPPCGLGLVQVLERDWLPPPQLMLQSPYEPQTDQPPSTIQWEIEKKWLHEMIVV
jgi:hypothetical protein